MLKYQCSKCDRVKEVKSKQGGVYYKYSKKTPDTCRVCDYSKEIYITEPRKEGDRE